MFLNFPQLFFLSIFTNFPRFPVFCLLCWTFSNYLLTKLPMTPIKFWLSSLCFILTDRLLQSKSSWYQNHDIYFINLYIFFGFFEFTEDFLLPPIYSIFYTGVCLFICLLKELGSEQAKSHWMHLFDFSPLCVFKCILKALAWADAKSHWLHWFFFSPLCLFKCVLKVLGSEQAKSHWLHLFDFSPLCVFKCFLKWPVWEEA